MTENDSDLLPRCRRGDEAAWAELVRRHTRRVFAVAYQFTGRVEEAEDLTQEVFVKVYQSLHRFDSTSGSFTGWLASVARHHAIDRYRRSRQERLRRIEDPEVVTRAVSGDEGPAEQFARDERAHMVHRALLALPVELRSALILCDLQGMPYSDIADTLALPLGTVKSRINRARVELARRLRGRLGTQPDGRV